MDVLAQRMKTAVDRALGTFRGTATSDGFDVARIRWGGESTTRLFGRFEARPDGGTDIHIRTRITLSAWMRSLVLSLLWGSFFALLHDVRTLCYAAFIGLWTLFVVMLFVDRWLHRRALQDLFRIPDGVPVAVS
jgi:hypothetical protein